MGKQGSKRSASGPSKGHKTREAIVKRAMHIAGEEGLAAISIGRLAKELRMTKSGLFVHFGSKDKLEEAVVARAADIFRGHILYPAEDEVGPGIERIWALCDFWLEFVEDRVLPGGYFFSGAFFLHAGQHDFISRQIREVAHEWLQALQQAVNEARTRGEIGIAVNAKRTALELNSVLLGAQWSRLLGGLYYASTRSAILTKLKSLATEKIPAKAFDSVMAWQHYLKTRPQ